METFVAIILIVFGLLQIILFFKLWRMTVDVSEINKKINLEKKDDVFLKAEIEYYRGDLAKAKYILDTEFFRQYLLLQKFGVCDYSDREELELTFNPYYDSMDIDKPKLDDEE
ncbi:MAG: hypothetical protein QM660_10560 [Dysgonomonas sp.]